MKNSELKQLIRECVNEMFDPYEDATYDKDVNNLDKVSKAEVVKSLNIVKTIHKKLVSLITSKYGKKFEDFEIYMSVGPTGETEIEINGSPINPKASLGGDLIVKIKV
jgi:hypothetical protein